MKKIISIAFALLPYLAFAQKMKEENKRKPYSIGASEFIFSFGDVKDPLIKKIDPVLRFSGFFHVQNQVHFDFSNHAGMYWGLGVRNVGFINIFNDSITIKQRSYSLGLPLAVKIGNMKKGNWLAAGGEAELMFAYKQKVFYRGAKFKEYEWFSDKVNLLNPSVFAELHFKKGSYLRFKYYLLDFLKKDKQEIKLNDITPFEFKPTSSKLFYVSIGTAIKNKDARKLNKRKNSNKQT